MAANSSTKTCIVSGVNIAGRFPSKCSLLSASNICRVARFTSITRTSCKLCSTNSGCSSRYCLTSLIPSAFIWSISSPMAEKSSSQIETSAVSKILRNRCSLSSTFCRAMTLLVTSVLIIIRTPSLHHLPPRRAYR
jgi:hypothetical protein